MKYVMIRVAFGKGKEKMERDVPIIFPNMLVHKHVSALVCRHFVKDHLANSAEPIAAGEIGLADVACFGHSETLGLKSREDVDKRVIETYDYTHGVVP